MFVAIQAQPKFCDVGVQCNIERRHQKESTPHILEKECAATEEESDCNDKTDTDTNMFPTEMPLSSTQILQSANFIVDK